MDNDGKKEFYPQDRIKLNISTGEMGRPSLNITKNR